MKKYLYAINQLVEIKTSIAIFTSTIVATLYGYYINGHFKFDLFLALILCTVSLDAVATVFNNIYDYYKAIDKEGYLYNVHNPLVYYELKPIFAWIIGLGLLGIAGITGLYLVYQTSFVLLLIGVVSALIAVGYSMGKLPISYYPLSEFISGFFEGCIVFMVASFLQIGHFTFISFIISIPIAISISNIMLANNTVDIEEDIKNKRRTLPILLGRKRAIGLFVIQSILMMGLTFIFAFLKLIPITMLLLILIIPIMYQNINKFKDEQTKAKGFVFALKNSLLFNGINIIAYLIAIILM